MKKLSVNSTERETLDVFSMSIEPMHKIVRNGFSGFVDKESIEHKGLCVECQNKHCAIYAIDEIFSERFKAFPKNESIRVCPTDAIRFQGKKAFINEALCFGCGLCVHRCPFMAIQFDINKRKAQINDTSDSKCQSTCEEQQAFINKSKLLPAKINFASIKTGPTTNYINGLSLHTKSFPDLSEIIVRNTFLNMGFICNTNAAGNNHIRIEFFAEKQGKIIIGESDINETDTLAVTRRILDDLAVLISRYAFRKEEVIPLAVLNGLPNKRADFYEVVEDINNVLDIQVRTMTYHILFLLNIFNIKLSVDELSTFIINRRNVSLTPYVKAFIPNIEQCDNNIATNNYTICK